MMMGDLHYCDFRGGLSEHFCRRCSPSQDEGYTSSLAHEGVISGHWAVLLPIPTTKGSGILSWQGT